MNKPHIFKYSGKWYVSLGGLRLFRRRPFYGPRPRVDFSFNELETAILWIAMEPLQGRK